MKTIIARIIGIVLMGSALIGLVFSLLGIWAVWRYRPHLEKTLINQTDLLISTLESTTEGLSVAEEALTTASISMDTLKNVLTAFSKSIADSKPMVASLSTLLSDEIPNTISSTQASLESAQSSAKIIDDLLRILTAIPFFPGDPYNPQVPLNVALGQVSDSLEPLPQSLNTMERSLVNLEDNLEIVTAEFELIDLEIDQIKRNLDDSQHIIADQVAVNQGLIKQLENTQKQIPQGVSIFTWITSICLLWLATTQVGLFLQGNELWLRHKP